MALKKEIVKKDIVRKSKLVKPNERNQPKPESFSDKYEQELLKHLFSEEIQEKLKKEKDNDSPYFESNSDYLHNKRDGEWDVLLDEEIKYFDSDLSYEITGYRPITMTQGLDFDPTPFTEVANLFRLKGSYTEYPEGCKPHVDFWNEQKRRCVEGYTVGKYRITGDHYFFLNFYRMPIASDSETRGLVAQEDGFPHFVAKQYEFFHYIELCEVTNTDCIMLKARAMGFSEILASLGVRPFITTRLFKTCYTAHGEAQLSPVLEKCWWQLNWLNMNTNGGMKRLRQKIDNILHKRASVINEEKIEYGRMSEIFGIVADHPRKVRGNRVHRLIFEEGGSNPNSITSWIQGNALVELGGRKIGQKFIGGTGGDSSNALAGLAKMFLDPIAYSGLPYKNFYSRDGKVQYTGFFLPAHEFSLDKKYVDSRGVTNSIEFKKYYEKKRNLLQGIDLLDYCAEHCFTPDEALLKQGDNMFDAVALSERLTDIKVHHVIKQPEKMYLIWDKSEGAEKDTIRAIPNPNGKILVAEPPLLDETGSPYKNLYVAGIDAIDMGTADSATDRDVSDFCIIIKRRIHGMKEPKFVAMYKDRPTDIRIAFDNAMKLLMWYRCQALLEYSKITIQTYFKEKGKSKLFMARPEFAITNQTKFSRKQKNLIGVPATENVIKHGLELLMMYVNDYCHLIDFEEVLEQLLNYSYQMKKKFDIVAALIMCEIADEELSGVNPTVIQDIRTVWKDYGYYIDENGIKRKGILPTNNLQVRWQI